MRDLVERLVRHMLAPYIEQIAELRDEIEDLHRRAVNMNRIGTCIAVDPAAQRCRVSHGDNATPWIKYFQPAAGEIRETRHPSVGEQCLLINYGGGDGSAQAMALFGLPTAQYPPVSSDGHVTRRTYPDGTTSAYDHAAHRSTFDLGSLSITSDLDGHSIMHGGNGIRIDSGGVHVIGSGLDHNGANVGEDHTHDGVQTGSGKTKGPSK